MRKKKNTTKQTEFQTKVYHTGRVNSVRVVWVCVYLVSPVSFLKENPSRAIFLPVTVLNRQSMILLANLLLWYSFMSITFMVRGSSTPAWEKQTHTGSLEKHTESVHYCKAKDSSSHFQSLVQCMIPMHHRVVFRSESATTQENMADSWLFIIFNASRSSGAVAILVDVDISQYFTTFLSKH